jgi:hypothetical protein
MCKHFTEHFTLSIIVLIFFSISIIQAQVDTLWTKTFGGSERDVGFSVQQTIDEGYIITGYTSSFGAGYDDVWLIKTNADGDTLWTKTFGESNIDLGQSVQQTMDGGYIITGNTPSFGSQGYDDVWLIKTNANGDTQWTKKFGGSYYDEGISVQQTKDGGYFIAGDTWSFGAGHCDIRLIKTNIDGDTLWTKTLGGSNNEYVSEAMQTKDEGYIIIGWTNSFGAGHRDAWLIKTNYIGDTLWTKTFGGSGDDWGQSIQQTSDEGYILTILKDSSGDMNGDVWLIKTTVTGDTIWTKTFGGNEWDGGNSVRQTKDGGYIITGYTNSFGVDSADVWLIKTKASGDTLWTKTFGGSSDDDGISIQQTKDGGYIITGYTRSFSAGEDDIWLIKTTPDTITTVINKFDRLITLKNIELEQNYPNPFNPKTNFAFSIPKSDLVTISIYTVSGQIIESKTMNLNPGSYSYEFDGARYSSGIYFYKMSTSSGFSADRKMVLLK